MSKKIEALVTRGHHVRGQMNVLKDELTGIESSLIDADGRKTTVVESDPSIAVSENIEDAQGVACERFGKLFEKVVTYKPVKSFCEVTAALLTKAARIISLCEKPKAPWIKWNLSAMSAFDDMIAAGLNEAEGLFGTTPFTLVAGPYQGVAR